MAPGITLTGAGAVLLMLLAGALGAVIDFLIGPSLGLGTVVTLAAGTLAATWMVRRRNLSAVVIAAPLVYLALILLSTAVLPSLAFSLTSIVAMLVYGFPAMGIATLIAVVIGLIRLVSRR